MIRMHDRRFAGALLGAMLASLVQAADTGIQFSAETLDRAPDGQAQRGRIFVGEGRMRTEMSHEGRQIVRIVDQTRRMEWLLFPEQRTYAERGASPGAEAPPAAPVPTAETGPCAVPVPGLTCKRVGEEAVAGRPAIKWEIAMTRDGQSLSGTQWLDVERGMPLKTQRSDGQGLELRMLGQETIAGRTVEKWEMTASAPNQPPVQSFQWYDPQLRLSVREELPGGYVRELANIQVGAQPDDLFTVPAGYQRMELPAPGAGPRP